MRIYTDVVKRPTSSASSGASSVGTGIGKVVLSPTLSSSSASSMCSSVSMFDLDSLSSSSSMNGSISGHPNSQGSNGAATTMSIRKLQVPTIFTSRTRPNISMHKFIRSKGKEITNSTQNLSTLFGSQNDFTTIDSLKPARMINNCNNNNNNTANNNHNNQFFRKRLSAIDKIQEELKEMKAREEELKCQRIHRIGLSYPNLNSICDEDFISDDQQTIESSEDNKDSLHSRFSSNPDLNSSSASSSCSGSAPIVKHGIVIDPSQIDAGLTIGGPRRKIGLIALWEQKIQQEEQRNCIAA